MPIRVRLHVIACLVILWPKLAAAPALAADKTPPQAEAGSPAAPSADAAAHPWLNEIEAPLPAWFPKLLGAQWTVINQKQFPFHSDSSGPNSLNEHGEDKTSQTRSAYFGARVTDNFHLYTDVEWFVGNGIHGGNGLGGYSNIEVVKAGSANLAKKPYLARYYGEYMLPLSGESADQARGMDQLPGRQPTEFAIAKFGKLSTADDFDNNRYANNGRTNFINFALVNNGAWDYAADTRGYTYGAMVGVVRSDWALKLGTYALPVTENGARYDTYFTEDHADNIEFTLKALPNDAIVRFLAYANHGRMPRYSTVLSQARATGTTPDVATQDVSPGHLKYGFGLNGELPLADGGDTGVFMRAGWNDGRTATFAFTEIDRQVSAGGQLSGVHWGRDDDWLGLAIAANFLSNQHRAYLAAGGVGFMIGDGSLRKYQPEEIVETYYNLSVLDNLRLGPDYQFIRNPAYNGDRGPVHIVSFRLRAAM